jgi:hypothetical protein
MMMIMMLIACAESVCISVSSPIDRPCLITIDGSPQEISVGCDTMVCVADGDHVELDPVEDIP